MTYGTETVIPGEIGLCNMRVTDFALEKNDTRLAKDLDLLEEWKEMALIKLADYQ